MAKRTYITASVAVIAAVAVAGFLANNKVSASSEYVLTTKPSAWDNAKTVTVQRESVVRHANDSAASSTDSYANVTVVANTDKTDFKVVGAEVTLTSGDHVYVPGGNIGVTRISHNKYNVFVEMSGTKIDPTKPVVLYTADSVNNAQFTGYTTTRPQ